MDKKKQGERILKMLQSGLWFTGLDFTRMYPPILCYTKRLSELRRVGHVIEKRRTTAGLYQYRLVP